MVSILMFICGLAQEHDLHGPRSHGGRAATTRLVTPTVNVMLLIILYWIRKEKVDEMS